MPGTARRLQLYVLTGGTAAIVDIGGFALLGMLPVPTIFAAAISYCTSVVVNYLLTSRYVFRTTATPQRFAVFFPAMLIGLFVNVSVTTICVSYFGAPHVAGKTIAIGVTFLMNFSINEYFVFRFEWRRRRKVPSQSRTRASE